MSYSAGEINKLAAEYLGYIYDDEFVIDGQGQLVWSQAVTSPPTVQEIERAWLPAARHQRKELARAEKDRYIADSIEPYSLELAMLGPPAITAAQQETILLFVRDVLAAVNAFDDAIDLATLETINEPAVDWPHYGDSQP
jgi:sensor domain CHASE-containing protein